MPKSQNIRQQDRGAAGERVRPCALVIAPRDHELCSPDFPRRDLLLRVLGRAEARPSEITIRVPYDAGTKVIVPGLEFGKSASSGFTNGRVSSSRYASLGRRTRVFDRRFDLSRCYHFDLVSDGTSRGKVNSNKIDARLRDTALRNLVKADPKIGFVHSDPQIAVVRIVVVL